MVLRVIVGVSEDGLATEPYTVVPVLSVISISDIAFDEPVERSTTTDDMTSVENEVWKVKASIIVAGSPGFSVVLVGSVVSPRTV